MNENELDDSELELPDGGLKSLEELQDAQYIRAEWITPVFRPKITLNYNDMLFNAACVRLMDDTEYIHLLVLPKTRRLVAMPCQQLDKDAVKWSIMKSGRPCSRKISAKAACGKLFEMMSWDINYRYKVMAVYQVIKEQRLIVFNLEESEMYVPDDNVKPDAKGRIRRKKVYPIDWQNSFGSPYSEHKNTYAVELDQLHFLSDDIKLSAAQPAVDGRIPTAKELTTREYYRPDSIKKGDEDK